MGEAGVVMIRAQAIVDYLHRTEARLGVDSKSQGAVVLCMNSQEPE